MKAYLMVINRDGIDSYTAYYSCLPDAVDPRPKEKP